MVLRVPIGGYVTGGAIWHSQSRRVDLHPHPRADRRDALAGAATPSGCCGPPCRPRTRCSSSSTSTCCASPTPATPSRRRTSRSRSGRAGSRVDGDDLTIVTWGATVEKSRQAAAALAAEDGSSVRGDRPALACCPWDHELVAEQVARTGRLLVVHEDVLTSGFGAEVAAWVGGALLRRSRRPGAPGRRRRHPRGLRADPGAGHPAAGRRHRGRRPGAARLLSRGVLEFGAWLSEVRGVVAWEKGAPVRLETVVVPDPGPGEAVVAVRGLRGVPHRPPLPRGGDQRRLPLPPRPRGGRARSKRSGDGVTNVAPGDYVVLAWRAPCGACRSCRRGRPVVLLRQRQRRPAHDPGRRHAAVAGARASAPSPRRPWWPPARPSRSIRRPGPRRPA